MNLLTFDAPVLDEAHRGKRVRTARFEPRSQLPLNAACVVAGGMRERLSAAFTTPVSVRVLEPRMPTAHAWHAILRDAQVYGVRGTVTDAAIVLRPYDALAIASAAFGEPVERSGSERPLSAIERDVVGRTVAGLAMTLAAVCGETRDVRPCDANAPAGFATYFEVAVEEPVEACIGVGVAREPQTEPCAVLQATDLSAVPLHLAAGIELGTMTAGAASALAVGDIVPIIPAIALRGTLRIDGRTLATGTCGVRNGRYALELEGNIA